MSKELKVTITMDESRNFKVDSNIDSIHVIGFLEYAKAVLLRDSLPVAPGVPSIGKPQEKELEKTS